jgi:hypothetical protein
MTELTPAQGRVLLYKFDTGDFGEHTWPTVKFLLDNGYLTCNYSRRIDVTSQGREWCLEHHMDLQYSY